MKKTAWSGFSFNDFINSKDELFEGENGAPTVNELLIEYSKPNIWFAFYIQEMSQKV